MRILITGSRGTLGRPLRDELYRHGYHVWGCDLQHSGDERYIRADIRNFRELEQAFEKAQPTFCYHLAAEFGRHNGHDYYETMWASNVIGTRNVIELCIRMGVQLIFASCSEAYGRLADEYTLKEELLDALSPSFHNEYALSKWTNEHQIGIAQERGLRAVRMRIFNVYGPGEHYTPYRSVVCRFLHAARTGQRVAVTPNAVRQLLYVSDFVSTAARIVERFKDCEGKAINIAHPEEVTIRALAEMVGVPYSLIPDTENVTVKRAEISRAKLLLNHNPLISLREGLERTREWMEKQSPTAEAVSTSSMSDISISFAGLKGNTVTWSHLSTPMSSSGDTS